MPSRKDLIAHIAMVERRLHRQQRDQIKHKRYFITLLKDNKVLVLAPLLLSFVWGWRQRRSLNGSKWINDLIRISLSSVLAGLKQHFLLALKG